MQLPWQHRPEALKNADTGWEAAGWEEFCSWWEVPRVAEEKGQVENVKIKGRTRQNAVQSLMFPWKYRISESFVATKSPAVEWLGMSWRVRFQLSPFDPGIPHSRAWSLYFGLATSLCPDSSSNRADAPSTWRVSDRSLAI